MTTTMTDKINEAKAALEKYPKARQFLREYRRQSDAEIAYRITDLLPTGRENVELMRDVLSFARKEQRRPLARRHFDMSPWFSGRAVGTKKGPDITCGTQGCLAGTAVMLSLKPGWLLQDGTLYTSLLRPAAGYTDIATEGQKRLGLTNEQARFLFFATEAKAALLTELASIVVGEDLRP